MVLVWYKDEADAVRFAGMNDGIAKIKNKSYKVSKCGIYNLITDKKSLQQGQNHFEAETPQKLPTMWVQRRYWSYKSMYTLHVKSIL